MSFSTERSVIHKHFADNWTETEVAYDNVEFEPQADASWVRIVIRNGEGNQADINDTAPLFRYSGVVIVQVFVPIRKGTDNALKLADAVSDIFRRQQLNHGIVFRTPYVTNVGQTNEWYQINVSCPFWRDEFGI